MPPPKNLYCWSTGVSGTKLSVLMEALRGRRYTVLAAATLLIALLMVPLWWMSLPANMSPSDLLVVNKSREVLTCLAVFVLMTSWLLVGVLPLAYRDLGREAAKLSKLWGLDMTHNAMDKYPQLTMSQKVIWIELCAQCVVIRRRIALGIIVWLTFWVIILAAVLW